MIISSALFVLCLGVATNAHPLEERGGSLSWGPCTYNYSASIPVDCATLQVPRDYTKPNCSTIDLQLLRVKASQQPSKGSILYNPGGPGGSATDDLAAGAKNFLSLFYGQFNIIGFDPRGTGRTMPFACNYTPLANSKSSRSDNIPERDMKSYLSDNWEDIQHFANICYEDNKETGSYLSTAFVARDMVQIIDALGEDGMLRYYGQSYGTVLGQTFAAMFPERVDRMLLDAVADPTDFRDGLWAKSTLDTEKSFDNFLNECIRTPALCELSNITGPSTTAESIKSAYADLLAEVLKSQQSIQGGPSTVPVFPWRINTGPITIYEYLKRATVSSLYTSSGFSGLAGTLSRVIQRNFTVIEQSPAAVPDKPTYNKGTAALWGIGCSDSSVRASSPEEIFPIVEKQQASSLFADGFLPSQWACAAWKFQPAERYEGKYEGKTKNPILFINGIYDPVTPLESAKDASARFEGSGLLTHKGQGHTISGQKSNCTLSAVKEYFVERKLPPPGTVCEPNEPAFLTPKAA